MIYLIIMIIAAIILVAMVIRRLPYMRAYRLSSEITRPSAYLRFSKLTELWYELKHRLTGLTQRRLTFGRSLPPLPMVRTPIADSLGQDQSANSLSSPQQLENFWQEELYRPSPLEIPTRGLITRRGESQKIAQELTTQADEAFRHQDFKEAEKYYLQAAMKDPNNARIYNRLGVIYLNVKNYKDAVEAFRGALKFDDRVASRHYNLALAYLGRRDYRSAAKGLREAVRLDPTNEKYRMAFEAVQKQ